MRLALNLVTLAVFAATSSAQSSAVAQPSSPPNAQPASGHHNTWWPRWEIDAYGGVASHSPGAPRLGLATNRDHRFLGAHIVRQHAITGRIAIGYAMEVVPLLIVTNNPTGQMVLTLDHSLARWTNRTSSVTGVAVSPLGVEFTFLLTQHLEAFAAAAGGGVLFNRAMPSPSASRLNFTAEVGLGTRWKWNAKHSLIAGYKFHHISNGGFATSNLGVDGNVFLIGAGWNIGLPSKASR